MTIDNLCAILCGEKKPYFVSFHSGEMSLDYAFEMHRTSASQCPRVEFKGGPNFGVSVLATTKRRAIKKARAELKKWRAKQTQWEGTIGTDGHYVFWSKIR